MTQCNGPAEEAVGMGGVAAADGGLCLTDRTEHLVRPGPQKEKLAYTRRAVTVIRTLTGKASSVLLARAEDTIMMTGTHNAL